MSLERELTALGRALDAPTGEFLDTRVRAAIGSRAPRRRRHRLAIVIAVLITAVGGAYANVPAVAEWLGVKGVELRQEPPPTTVVTTGPFDIGRRMTIDGVEVLVLRAKVRIADQLLATKFADAGTKIEPVSLGTGPAFWIEGAHYVAFYDRRGDVVVDDLRLSQNVLLWEQGDVTFRLEGDFDRDTALRIAKSLR
jgi:hypothetical protein